MSFDLYNLRRQTPAHREASIGLTHRNRRRTVQDFESTSRLEPRRRNFATSTSEGGERKEGTEETLHGC
jgi:hypothetical protein